jgi:hypothetical protein
MNNQIDDLLILGFSFSESQLADLRAAVITTIEMYENSSVDPNMALTDRLKSIRERLTYMIQRKQAYKQCLQNF